MSNGGLQILFIRHQCERPLPIVKFLILFFFIVYEWMEENMVNSAEQAMSRIQIAEY